MRIIYLVCLILLSSCITEEEEDIYKDWTPKRLFNQAKTEISNNEIDAGIAIFERLQAGYPASKYSQQSRLLSAYALYNAKEFKRSLAAYQQYIDLYPDSQEIDYAYYMLAVVSQNQSKSLLSGFLFETAQKNSQGLKQALKFYTQLIKRFPNSKYSKEALGKLTKISNDLAKHELLVAAFYYRKKSFVASVNRLQYLLKNYPKSTAIPVALTLLVKSYHALGLKTSAQDIDKILKLNYPNLTIDLKKELNI